MKKISIALVIIILVNFICGEFVYADTTDDLIEDDSAITYSEESFNTLTEEGEVELDGSTTEVSVTTSTVATVTSALVSVVAQPMTWITYGLSILTIRGGFKRTDGDYSAFRIGWFTVCSLVFDEYAMFDINVYDSTSEITPSGTDETAVTRVIDAVKDNVMGYFMLLRYVGLALFMVLLIFTFIRLGISTLAEDKARYKEALKIWVGGLIFLYMLPYIISTLNTIVGYVSDALYQVRLNLEEADYSSFESTLFKSCMEGVTKTTGLKYCAYFIEFTAFVIIDIKFLLKYIYRSFKIFLLIFLAPIITVLHMFNKIRGRDGIIGEWVKQYTMNLVIQPLDALLYCIFMFTASEITLNAPLLAVVFIWALLRSEKIVQVMLNINTGKISTLFSKDNNR